MYSPHQDQASGLRRIMSPAKPFVMTVLSVMKAGECERMIRDLAISLGRQGSAVLVIHARISHGEIANYFDMEDSPSLMDFSTGRINKFKRSIHTSPGISISRLLPSNKSLCEYTKETIHSLNEKFIEVTKNEEIVIVNCSLTAQKDLPIAELNHSQIVIQMGQQAESITQAYQLIKTLHKKLNRQSFGILICDADDASGHLVFKNIAKVALDYLQIELHFVGLIPGNPYLNQGGIQRWLGADIFPSIPISNALNKFALTLGAMKAHHPSSMLSI
jgi:flagellar biosynthesis protein FlhG